VRRSVWPLALVVLLGCGAPADPGGTAWVGPNASGPLALSADGRSLWVVNPDADSVTRVDTRTLEAAAPRAVGREPWAVSVTPSGLVVVMNRLGGSLTLLDGGSRSDVPVGPEPGGLALSLDGSHAYVTVSSADEVAVVDLRLRQVVRRVPVGRVPWAVAVRGDADGDEVVVAHRFARPREGGGEARNDGKEAFLTVVRGDSLAEVVLPPVEFGYPNVLEGLALAGGTVLVAHQLNRPEPPRDFENTVSGGLATIALDGGAPALAGHLHLNDDDFSTPTAYPRAVALTVDGATAFVVLSGSDAVMGVDLADPRGPRLLGFWPAGSNPRGIVLDEASSRAYVMNYLSRDVSVLDVADIRARREIARIDVAPETLDPELLRGKVLFNNASDPRISHLGWISCASCHPDGGSDTTTWVTPEGHRQTMPLWRLDGTAPFHASATRDEIQDFEVEIEGFMGGWGLAPGPVAPLLGEPNGGRSADLDALATYVLRGIRTAAAPAGDPALVALGREVFAATGCAECHAGPAWTRSSLPGPVGTLAPDGEEEVVTALVDVGTYAPETDVLGANGFDVPTLLGLHATAPYLHDGRAATLEELLEWHGPAGLATAEREALVAFLASIDDTTEPFGE
jgi:YVTN family beta-propeller protein